MLGDRMGYILAESFNLLMIISFTKAILGLRRGQLQRSLFSENDRINFFQSIRLSPSSPHRFLRYTLIFALVVSTGAVEIVIFSQFGAAILTGVLLLTWAAIVHLGLREGLNE
jgi:hypothetical protein